MALVERTKTLELIDPIPDGTGKVYTTLKLRSPLFGESKLALKRSGDAGDETSFLLSIIAGVPESVIDSMEMWQVEEAMEFITSFSEARKQNGKKRARI